MPVRRPVGTGLFVKVCAVLAIRVVLMAMRMMMETTMSSMPVEMMMLVMMMTMMMMLTPTAKIKTNIRMLMGDVMVRTRCR